MLPTVIVFSLLVLSVASVDTKIEKYAKKFSPKTILNGDHVSRKYPKYLMEVTLSFGMTEETTLFIESVIETHFSGNLHDIDGMRAIGDTVQDYLGGYWSVTILEDPYIFYNTAVRRSSSFVVFDVNGFGIVVLKEA